MVSRNVLGDLTVGIRAPLGTFRQDLTQAEGAATATGGRIGNAFSNAQSKIQNAARQVPVFGDQLAALATPTGAATLAFTGLSAAVVGSVQKIINLERELRPLVQRSGLTIESLQILAAVSERLGGENGLESVTEAAQELQIRLSEAVLHGTGPAVEAFEALGLSAAELIRLSPEEMLRAVIAALQDVTSETHRKFLADEVLGGVQEELAGILNATTSEFRAQEQAVRDTHAIMTKEGAEGAQELAIEMDELSQTVDKAQLNIGLGVIPVLNDLIGIFRQPLIPESQKQGFSDLTSAAEAWVLVGSDMVIPGLRDLGDGFEDMATSVLEDSKATFDKSVTTSFPYMIDDGMNTAVQAMGKFREAFDELEANWKANSEKVIGYTEDTTEEIGYQEEGYKSLKQEAEATESVVTSKSLSMKDGVIEHGKPMRTDIKDTTDKVKELATETDSAATSIDEDWKQMEDDADEHLGNIQDDIDTWVTDSLQAYNDSYDDKLQAQLDFYDAEDGLIKTQAEKFKEIEEDTGIHLTNIEGMYAATGTAVAMSWSAMMNNMAAQVDQFIGGVTSHQGSEYMPKMFQSAGALNPFSGVNAVQGTDASEATWQVMTPDGWVDQDSLTREELDALFATGARTRRVHDTLGVVSSVGDTGTVYSQDVTDAWRYYLDRLAAAPITAGSPYAHTRADLGLSPVGSTPPTLPGLPGFADGGIAMRPMAANIAESGPEAIIPLQKVGGTTINVIFGEGAVLANDAVEFVLDALHEASRRGFA